MLIETLGLPCKFNKDGLSQILSQVRIGVRFAECRGIDHVQMPLNQLFESWLAARLSVFAKEFVIGCHARLMSLLYHSVRGEGKPHMVPESLTSPEFLNEGVIYQP